jgi:serine phosphatase RsbU (regulator of sigma subunit)
MADRGETTTPVDEGGDRDPSRPEGAAAGRTPRWTPLRLPLLIVVIGGLLTALLTWAAASANAGNEHRLLKLQVRQAGSALGTFVPSLAISLTAGFEVAAATHNPQQFAQFLAQDVGPGKLFVSASLWRIAPGPPTPLVVVGATPLLQTHGLAAALFSRVHASRQLSVTEILQGPQPRLGYAAIPPKQGSSKEAVYAEIALPSGHKAIATGGSAFSDLNFALYLGHTTDANTLIEQTGALTGYRAVTTIPLGDTVLTLIGTETNPLAGGLSAALPWIAAFLGVVLTAVAALMAQNLVRRRGLAEVLAANTADLYVEQRTIAETLQRSLLPRQIPSLPGLVVAVRYAPGVGGIEVGGDWYDVIPTGKGRASFVVGDVSGRGLSAATTMAFLRHAIRAYTAQGDGPAVILTKLGDLIGQPEEGYFATVLCGSIDVDRHLLTLASAGHFAPLVIDQGAAHYVDLEVGPPIGVVPRPEPTEVTITVPPRATVVAFTDGLVERRGEHLDVGLARLAGAAESHQGPIDELLGRLLVDLAPAGSDDDIAILGVQWLA